MSTNAPKIQKINGDLSNLYVNDWQITEEKLE